MKKYSLIFSLVLFIASTACAVDREIMKYSLIGIVLFLCMVAVAIGLTARRA